MELASRKKGARKLLSMGSTFLTVGVLTCLLWVWADQAQLNDQVIKAVFTLATAADSRLIIMSVDDGSGQETPETPGGGKLIEAKVTFVGTHSRLRELETDLKSGGLALFAYLSEPPYHADIDPIGITIVDLLNTNEDLRDRGVTAIQAEPDEISVVLDEWVAMEVKLAVRSSDEPLRFQPRIDPPEIIVDMPASLKKVLEHTPEPLLVALAHVPDPIKSGQELEGTVLTTIAGKPVRPERSTVKVTLQPLQQDTESLGRLQIHANLQLDMVGYSLEWKEEADQWLEVEVTGPRAEINKLRSASEEKVRAEIWLSRTHAGPTDTYYPVPVKLSFSEDIHGIKLAGPPKNVQVRLRRLPEK